ncbi:MAG: hypothetical protein IKU37_08945 [Candidatus Gastranaerophilales bacterium]|nr:hypothetical protein [Candidatus Gastranaerophilales bacterium]
MFFSSEADRLAYLNFLATSTNLAINAEILQINRMIYQSNEQRNKELIELLKEIKNGNTKNDL